MNKLVQIKLKLLAELHFLSVKLLFFLPLSYVEMFKPLDHDRTLSICLFTEADGIINTISERRKDRKQEGKDGK